METYTESTEEQWIKTEAGSGCLHFFFFSSKKLLTGTTEVTPKHQTKLLVNEFGDFHDAKASLLALLLWSTSGFGSFAGLWPESF